MPNDIFNPTRVACVVGGREVIFESGRMANQADGAVWVQCGGTVVLVTVCSQTLEFDKGFFPLTVEYSEKMYAAGRIPGSFFRREIGRPSERETLVSRLIDRPIRPLFPKGLNEDVQILASVISEIITSSGTKRASPSTMVRASREAAKTRLISLCACSSKLGLSTKSDRPPHQPAFSKRAQ